MHTVHLWADPPVRCAHEAARGQTGNGTLPSGLFVGGTVSDRKRPGAKALLDSDGHGLSDGEPAYCRKRSPDGKGISPGVAVVVLSHWAVPAPPDDPRYFDGRSCAGWPGRQRL